MDFLSGSSIMALLTMVLIFTVGMAVMQAGQKITVGERLKKIAEQKKREAGEEEETAEAYAGFRDLTEEKSALANLLESILGMVGVDMVQEQEIIGMKFAQSGVSSPSAPIYYVFLKKFGGLLSLPFILFPLLSDATGLIKGLSVLVTMFVLLGGFFGVDLYLKNKKDKRQKILTRSFPDALDLILVCVEAGLALDAALSRVCRELDRAHPEMCKELNKTRMELTLLNDRQRALQNLAARTDLLPFKALVGALLQSERFGTSLTETLRVLSEDYRNTRLMIAENKANRLPALITIPLMLLMMPAFVLVLMGPAIINLMHVLSTHKTH